MKVKHVGPVCPYCGNDYMIEEFVVGCCGEIHYEEGFETKDGDLILESELTERDEVVDEL